MIISSTEMQNNFGKYLGLVNQEEIIISKNGKKVARLVEFSQEDDYLIREGTTAYSYDGKEVSYEEFLKITKESENRYELINGQIYLLASPKYQHQKIVLELSVIMSTWFKDKGCQPLISPFDVTLYKNEKPNVVQPDLLVICDQENIEEDDTYRGTPDLIVEVLSASTRSKDIIEKLDLYMVSGVNEYWIVNPFSREVNIYLFKNKEIGESVTFKNDEIARSFLYPELIVGLSNLFN